MKEYRYKAPADKIVLFGVCLLMMLYVFFFGTTTDTTTKIIINIGTLLVFALLIQCIIEFAATNINVRNIIAKKDRILIPHIYSDTHTTFYFEKITRVEVRTYRSSRVIYIESGRLLRTEIKRSWLESDAVFYELYDGIRNRVEIARENRIKEDTFKQIEMKKVDKIDDEHQLYEPPRKITFERQIFKRRFS